MSFIPYSWLPTDNLWIIAGRYLVQSHYPSTPIFGQAIIANNPQVLDWENVLLYTSVIYLPVKQ